MAIPFLLRDAKSSQISIAKMPPYGEIVFHNAKLLVHIAANIYSLMAADATQLLEKTIACLFVVVQCSLVAAQKAIKAGVGSNQRTFKSGDVIFDIARLNSIVIDGFELRAIILICRQRGNSLRPCATHLNGVMQRPVNLIFQRLCTTVPELPEIETAIEY